MRRERSSGRTHVWRSVVAGNQRTSRSVIMPIGWSASAPIRSRQTRATLLRRQEAGQMSDGSIDVSNNEPARRFEVQMNGQLAVLEYRQTGERIVFTHPEVPAALEGHGLASALARTALDDARARNLTVVPLCPFVRGYIE